MRSKFSLKFPMLVLVLSALGASSLGACGSDGGGGSCGNGVADGQEQCDGVDLHMATCASLTMNAASTGNPVCKPDCTIDYSSCSGVGGAGTGGGPSGTGGGP